MNKQDPPAGYPPPESYPPQYPTVPWYTPAPPEPPKKPRRFLTIVLSVLGTLLVLILAAAAFGQGNTTTPTPTVAPTEQAPAPAAPAPTQAPTTVPQDTQAQPPYGASEFDRYVVTGNDMTVYASTPQEFSPSATAAGNTGVRAFATDITVRNGTGQPLNPAMISVNASVDGQEAENVFDSAQNVGLPTTTVLPGRSVTYRAVFSSPVENGPVQVDVTAVTSTATFYAQTL
jgi:hypothetical protein